MRLLPWPRRRQPAADETLTIEIDVAVELQVLLVPVPIFIPLPPEPDQEVLAELAACSETMDRMDKELSTQDDLIDRLTTERNQALADLQTLLTASDKRISELLADGTNKLNEIRALRGEMRTVFQAIVDEGTTAAHGNTGEVDHTYADGLSFASKRLVESASRLGLTL